MRQLPMQCRWQKPTPCDDRRKKTLHWLASAPPPSLNVVVIASSFVVVVIVVGIIIVRGLWWPSPRPLPSVLSGRREGGWTSLPTRMYSPTNNEGLSAAFLPKCICPHRRCRCCRDWQLCEEICHRLLSSNSIVIAIAIARLQWIRTKDILPRQW